ncbi:MAG: NusG domain II-containing protein [Clostridia bacterium]|nr:NusG domain II-containing protein [Clostridia bacterium]
MKQNRLIRNDIILASLAVIISLGVYFALAFFGDGGGDIASVELDGKEIMTFSLDKDGVYMIEQCAYSFEVKDGCVSVVETNCKDKVCTAMRLDRNGGEIICLPNKLVIRCKTQKETAVDVTAG